MTAKNELILKNCLGLEDMRPYNYHPQRERNVTVMQATRIASSLSTHSGLILNGNLGVNETE